MEYETGVYGETGAERGSSAGRRDDGDTGEETRTTTVVVTVGALPDGFEKASVVVETETAATVREIQPALVSDDRTRVVRRADRGRTTRVQFVDLADAVGATAEATTRAVTVRLPRAPAGVQEFAFTVSHDSVSLSEVSPGAIDGEEF